MVLGSFFAKLDGMKKSTPPPPDSSTELPAGVPHQGHHTLAGTGALSGGIAGAVVGALAGPIGAIAGGAIGTALGAFAGASMDREKHQEEEHDRVLDEEIGVTSGSLGVPSESKHPNPVTLAEAAEAEKARAGWPSGLPEPFVSQEIANLDEPGEGG